MNARADGREGRLRAVKEAAWILFSETGYASTTIRQIAAKAKVSTGTVMSFGGKETLLLAQFEDGIAEHLVAPVFTTESAADAVWRFFEPYFEFYAERPELSRSYGRVLLSPAGAQHPALGAQAREFNSLVASEIGRRYPRAREADAAAAATALFAIYIHALVLWVSEAATLAQATAVFRHQVAWQLARFEI
ncbi:helix-turn-helix domain-containing protein [Glaciihabitans sp. UYNi722]|uniref:TetR/AcrR family transcriptional regulator n=1 Tax=Glaciihabitans sp. UYNi722 TaxID=3156344 RepID=UPI003393E192